MGATTAQLADELFIVDEQGLRNAVDNANEKSGNITITLPDEPLILSSPIIMRKASASATNLTILLRGSGVSAPDPNGIADTTGSALECGSDGMSLLEVFGDITFVVSGVMFRGCTRPALLVRPGSTARILIEGCVFTNLSRTLAPDRVNILKPEEPSAISESTAALAIHASGFKGALQIRNTTFTNNWFQLAPAKASVGPAGGSSRPQQRRLHEDFHRGDHGVDAVRGASSNKVDVGGPMADGDTGSIDQARRGMLSSEPDVTPAADIPELDDTCNLLLSHAAQLDPAVVAAGDNEGPWADDVEAVIAVLCQGLPGQKVDGATAPHQAPGASCLVELEQVVITNNTGVATSGVYMLCDGMAGGCSASLRDCTIQNNKLLWQGALDPAHLPAPGPMGTATEPGTGLKLFRAVAPWLTYTYPIIYSWLTDPAGSYNNIGLFQTYRSIDGTLHTNSSTGMRARAAALPSLTGRTLGAVMFHQRNSPSPGARPAAPAMMQVVISAGLYSGNDGAVFMSTATDWSRIAGGDGDWAAGSFLRHSADFELYGLRVDNQASGVPPVWIRWAKSVRVTDTQVTGSTGAIWLDEVRDYAEVDASSFKRNEMPGQRWLYYGAFLAFAPQESPSITYPRDLGAGSSHVVMIQMTPLGRSSPNTVVVTNSVFEENPAYVTGALFVMGSDRHVFDKNNLPGRTQVKISGTNFTRNYCRRFVPGSNLTVSGQEARQQIASSSSDGNGACLTGERPLYVLNVHYVEITGSWFEGNANGGAYIHITNGFNIVNSTFVNNTQSYSLRGAYADAAIGGGALTGISIGTAGATIQNCTFTNNSSPTGGGAVLLREYYFARFQDSRFVNNSASGADGGAIWLSQSEMKDTDANRKVFNGVFSCTFNNNTAGRRGGAIAASNVGSDSAWYVELCSFTDNQAMVNPLANTYNVARKMDQAGGGAIYAERSNDIIVTSSEFLRNRVLRHAGGGIRMVDSDGTLLMCNATFHSNVAIMGGAVATSRVASVQITDNSNGNRQGCRFINNTVTDPWVWPETSPVPGATNETLHVSLNVLQPGYGGAVYVNNADYATTKGVAVEYSTIFVDNTALAGGAIAMMYGSSFAVSSPPRTGVWSNLTLPERVISLPSMPNLTELYGGNPDQLPYTILFANNSALLGGAVYVRDVLQVKLASTLGKMVYGNKKQNVSLINNGFVEYRDFGFEGDYYLTPDSLHILGHPSIVFYNNTARGGGALYLEGNGKVNITNTRFLINSADQNMTTIPMVVDTNGSRALAPANYNRSTQLTGQQSQVVAISTQTCAAGGGGAICFVGRAGGTAVVYASQLLGNIASTSGGAVYVGEGRGCTAQPGCFQVAFVNATISGNNATNGHGGAVFWTYENTVSVDTCTSDSIRYKEPLPTSSGTPVNSTMLLLPHRKPPSNWYIKLAKDQREALLRPLGGPAVTSGLNMTNGALNSVTTGQTPGSSLSSSGLNNVTSSFQQSQIALLVVNDSAWHGMPHTQLPCADWILNSAGASGDDISTAPFFLMSRPFEMFYTSNTEMHFEVTVHDWFGYNYTKSNTAEQEGATLRVRADSPLVLGTTEVVASAGVASFSALKLRAREGPWEVNFRGRLTSLDRDLQPAQMIVHVRPCGINEFLAPGSLDECVKCRPGYYNIDSTAEECTPCPPNAECGYPGDGMGFLVPKYGTWHSHFFSNQILECPNPSACKGQDRVSVLTELQLKVWQITQVVQLTDIIANASDLAAVVLSSNASTPAEIAALLHSDTTRASAQGRRFMQDSSWEYWNQYDAFTNRSLLLQVYQATNPILPTYMSHQCAEGYAGVLCGECAPGYGWVKVATCVKCSSGKVLNSFYYALATLFTMASLTLAIRASLGPRFEVKGEHQSADAEQEQHRQAVPYPPILPMKQRGYTPTQSCNGAPAGTEYNGAVSTPTRPPTPAVQIDPNQAVAISIQRNSVDCSRNSPQPDNNALGNRAQHTCSSQPASPAASTMAKMSATSAESPRTPKTRRWSFYLQPQPVCPSFSSCGVAPPSPEVVVEMTPMPVSSNGGLVTAHYNTNADPSPSGQPPLSQPPPPLQPQQLSGSQVQSPFRFGPAMPSLGPMFSSEKGGMDNGGSMQVPPSPPAGTRGNGATAPTRADWEEGSSSEGQQEAQQSMRSQVSTVFRIAIAYLQVLALLDDVPLYLDAALEVFLGICRQATSYPGTLVSLECSLPSYLRVPKAVARILLIVFAPLYTSAGFVFLSVTASCLQFWARRFRQRLAQKAAGAECSSSGSIAAGGLAQFALANLNRQILVAVSTIMFFFYPSVTQTLFSIFYCQEVSTLDTTTNTVTTEHVWKQDFGMQCYSGSHLALVLGLGIPGLLFFGLGWPLINAVVVAKRLQGGAGYCDAPAPDASQSKGARRVNEVADYKPRWIWWESVTLLRQMAIAAVVTFVGTSNGGASSIQLLIVFFILVATIVAHTIARPYRSQAMGALALIAIYNLMATVYLLVFISQLDKTDRVGRAVVSAIIILINAAIIMAFIWFALQTYWYKLMTLTGLHNLDPESRRSLTYNQARARILTHMRTSGLSSERKTLRHQNSAMERLSHVRTNSVASSKAAVLVLGNSLSGVFSVLLNKVRSSSLSYIQEEASRYSPSAGGASLTTVPRNTTARR